MVYLGVPYLRIGVQAIWFAPESDASVASELFSCEKIMVDGFLPVREVMREDV
jgi:hypothetical protein